MLCGYPLVPSSNNCSDSQTSHMKQRFDRHSQYSLAAVAQWVECLLCIRELLVLITAADHLDWVFNSSPPESHQDNAVIVPST